ncbi:hypothetical protein Tco_0752276 [Tanacetum coccineum]|uniref:Uncharacterized protein n=1 Tax=Tanacetum coccineum TaxID=301880 RepID=A0ABQ4Z9K1_9ASTR
MSSSTVTYTSVYSDSKPWRFQWVYDKELEAPEEALQFPRHAPPSPDYVPGPEYPSSPDFVPGPKYLEYVAPLDDEVPINDQPLSANASPTSLSPSYIADSDPSEEDPKEDPAEYPAGRGDDDDDDDDKEEEDEEEDRHLDLANSTTLPAIDPIPSVEDTEAFETDESALTPNHTSPTCMLMEAATEALIVAVAAALPPSSPPPSPLTLLSSPFPHIPSPPLPLPSPPLPLPAPSSPLLLPATGRREDVPEANLGLDVTQATYYSFVDIVDATPRRPMSREVGYRITDVWDDMVRDMEERALTLWRS